MIRTVMFFEFAVGVLAVLFVLTQMFIPALRGTMLFPILRRKRQEAIEAVIDSREEKDVSQIRRAAEGYQPPPAQPASQPKAAATRRRAR